MTRDFNIRKTPEEQAEYDYDMYVLNEEMHVFRNCQDAIEDLLGRIHRDVRTTGVTEYRTDWSYSPELRRTVSRYEDEALYDDGYPIWLRYEDTADTQWFMAVADRKEYPDRIVIGINRQAVRRLCLYDLREKLKHEFGHIRQNYCHRDFDVSQARRFVNMSYDRNLFRIPDDVADDVYDVIDEFMYVFSPPEMQQRYSELYQHMQDVPQEELKEKDRKYGQRSRVVSYYMEQTDGIHMLFRMRRCTKQIAAAVSRKEDLVPLLIAYYFKTYGIWETSDYLSRQSVQHCIDTDTADEHCHRIARKFLRWLENVFVRRYMRYVYSVIHYVLYTRLWEFDDYLEYNSPHPEETLSRLRRDVRTADVEI